MKLGSAVVLLAILALAAILRVWGMDYGLPHPTARPDEERIVGRAMQILATGDFHPGDFTYPGLLKYLNSLALAIYVWFGKIVGRYDRTFDFLFDVAVFRPGLQYRICRAVSILLGVGTVAVTYVLGRDAYRSRATGLVAAATVATCLIHVRDSRFATVDVPMTFFITMSLWFAVRVSRWWRLRDFVLAGGFAGLATATKYNAGLVILGVTVATLSAFARDTEERPAALTLSMRLVLAGVVMGVVFALSTPFTLLQYQAVLAELAEIQRLLYSGTGERAIWIHLRETFPLGFGWPFFLAAATGVVRSLWLRRRADLVLLAFFIPSFAAAAGVRWVFPRYVIPYIPILAIFAAELLVVALGRSKTLPAFAFGLVLAGPGLCSSVGFDRLAAQKDTRVLASEWVAENVPPRSEVLLCRGYGAPFLNTDRRRPPPFAPKEIDCSPAAVTSERARYVITHEHPQVSAYSRISDEMRRFLEQSAEARVVLDPFVEGHTGEPYFYGGDAFFLPISDFSSLSRGGPIVTIWERDVTEGPEGAGGEF